MVSEICLRCARDDPLGPPVTQVALGTSGCLCQFAQSWFNVANGCGNLPNQFTPLSLYCVSPNAANGTCVGDVNADGVVSLEDTSFALADWGRCPLTGPCPSDASGDREVDLIDVTLINDNWNCTRPNDCLRWPGLVALFSDSTDGLALTNNATLVQSPRYFGLAAFQGASFISTETITTLINVDFSINFWFRPLRVFTIFESIPLIDWGLARVSFGGDYVTFSTQSLSLMSTTVTPILVDNWYSVTVSRLGPSLSIYLNGYRVGHIASTSENIQLVNPARFGADNVVMDDVALFSTGRTHYQVFEDYASRSYLRAPFCRD